MACVPSLGWTTRVQLNSSRRGLVLRRKRNWRTHHGSNVSALEVRGQFAAQALEKRVVSEIVRGQRDALCARVLGYHVVHTGQRAEIDATQQLLR